MAHPLVHLNAALNTTATVLLVLALIFIRQGREHAHKNAMRGALGVSVAFLVSYLIYHYGVGHVPFTHPGPVRWVYYTLLATHVPLAMTVPVFALWAAWLGTRALEAASPEAAGDLRRRHRRLVRWGYPIWLYVSISGVVLYLMLYHLFPGPPAA